MLYFLGQSISGKKKKPSPMQTQTNILFRSTSYVNACEHERKKTGKTDGNCDKMLARPAGYGLRGWSCGQNISK